MTGVSFELGVTAPTIENILYLALATRQKYKLNAKQTKN
jgi:hypothetical protein